MDLPPRMTRAEKRVARGMHFDRNMTPTEVAEALGRSLSTICRLLAQKKAPMPIGRPPALSETKIDGIVGLLEQMVDEADATHEVTMDMLMKRGRLKVCKKVVAKALHARGYMFRDLRQKPILTPDDVRERYKWTKKYSGQSKAWWLKTVHVHLDNHVFKVATTSSGRKLLAKRVVRGVYRQRGKSLRPGHVKPHAKNHLSLGTKGILKAGGVGDGKVLVWHTIDGKWSGDQAAEFYKGVVQPALKEHFPLKRMFCILDDNDPTGNQSKKGLQAKRDAKLEVLHIPKRSPDLNVLDFAVWSEVERRMRKQEKKWPASKRESRKAFERRLDRTAKHLPEEFVKKSIGDLQRRCELLVQAKGGLFEEGGRSRRPL